MFITLTNAAPAHKGNPIALRKDLIVTVNEMKVTRTAGDEETDEMVTFIFMPPHGTWEVQEPMSEVMDLLV